MKFMGGSILAALFLTSGVTDAASPNVATPLPSTSPIVAAVMLKAKEWFHRFESGDIDRTQLDALVETQLTDTVVRKEGATLRAFGEPTSFTFVRSYTISGDAGYDFLLQFKRGRIVEMIAFDPDGKIAGIDFMTFVPAGH